MDHRRFMDHRSGRRAPIATLMLLALVILASDTVHAQNPALSFVNGIGGTAGDAPTSVATDAAGNIYVTGLYRGTVDFDPGPSTATLTCTHCATGTLDADAFVASYDAAGAYRWAFRLGGDSPGLESDNFGKAIAINSVGDVIVTGRFYGTADFDPGPGTANRTVVGGTWPNMFVARYTSAGAYVWAHHTAAWASSLALASNDDIVVSGTFSGTVDFDPGAGTASLTSKRLSGKNAESASDVFVVRYAPSGAYQWAFRLGNEFGEDAIVAVDASGGIHLTGYINNSTVSTTSAIVDMNPGQSKANLTGPGAFVAKYTAAGAYVRAFKIGDASTVPGSIAIDATGSAVITGKFSGTVDFNPGTGTASLTGNGGLFVARYDAAGAYQWAINPTVANAGDVAFDGNGDILLTGSFNAVNDFDPGAGVLTLVGNAVNGVGGYLAKYSSAGTLLWAFAPSSTSGVGNGRAITTSPNGDIIAAGTYFNTVDFDPGDGVSSLTSAGGGDIFVAAYTEAMLPKWSGRRPADAVESKAARHLPMIH